MSERKQPCPLCDRPVGGQHSAACPRGSFQRRALDADCELKLRPRTLWLSSIFMTQAQMDSIPPERKLKGVKRTPYITFEGIKAVPLFKVPYQGQYVRPDPKLVMKEQA